MAPAGSRFEAVSAVELSPLTGRDQEIGLLKERWEQAQEGMGQVVLLVGEPGLGKSRLVYTMKQHVLGQMAEGEVDAPVIEWRCSPHFQNTGLYPAIDFYERALGFGPEEPPQDRFDRLLHRLQQYDLARPETVPLWASLLSLPTPGRDTRRFRCRLSARGKKHSEPCWTGCIPALPGSRSCSWSKICTGRMHRRWNSLGSFSPRDCTTQS